MFKKSSWKSILNMKTSTETIENKVEKNQKVEQERKMENGEKR